MQTAKRLYVLMGKNRKYYLLACLFSFITMSIALTPTLIIGFTVDHVLIGYPAAPAVDFILNLLGGAAYLAENLWVPFVILVGLTAIRSTFSYFNGRLNAIASENIAKELRDRVYDHLQKLPYDYHVKAKTGDLIQRSTSDVENIRLFLSGQIMELVRTILTAGISTAILITLNPLLTFFSLMILPLIFVSSYIFHFKIKKSFQIQDEMESELFETIQENLTGVRVVRAFGRSKYETDRFEKKNTGFRNLAQRLFRVRAWYWSSSDLLCNAQLFLTLLFGVNFAINGHITLGMFMIFLLYVNNLIWPIRNLARVLADMGRMGVSLDRLEEILDTPGEQETQGAVQPSLKGKIIFDDVSFTYEGDKSPILKNLSFEIEQGETVAFLGPTGSGKSTIMHILLRLYDYTGGKVFINGTELNQIEKIYLRKKIGLVLQEPFLYSKTVGQNLKMAKDYVKDTEMVRATKTAKIHHVIESFDKGYETMVGERGVTLSGGQRQRVAIARTIIKNSDILVFDDSLSAVDTDTDTQIRQALKEKQRGITTIIISQRITTLMEADRIFVIEKGTVTDSGTHDELIQREGLYKQIWNIQTMLEDE